MKTNSLGFAGATLFKFLLLFAINQPAFAAQQSATSTTTSGQSVVGTPQLALGVSASISPSIGLRNGKPFSVQVKVADCDPDWADPKKADPKKPHAPAKLSALGNGLTFTDVKPDQTCTLLATLTIDPSAFPVPTPVLIQDSGGKTIFDVNFNVADAPPGAIPPGLEPQVDVMWSVLPEKVVKDAFGSWIWKKYHSIEVVVGNNSGYDLQVASLGFQLRNFNHTFTPLNSDFAQAEKLPTNDYHIVRSTIEKEQTHGTRAVVLSTMEAAALLAAGGIPYFHNSGPKANYSTAIAIAGDPLVKAYNLIFPDPTIAELAHLDNLALHDSTIIPNNNQTRTVVFIPRDTLKGYFQQSSTHGADGLPCVGAKKTSTLMLISGEVGTRHCNDKNPLDVKYWLGNLILIGDQIQYRNRIQVKTSQQEPQVTPLKLTPADFVIEDLSTSAKVTLTGTSLEKLPNSISPIAGGTLKLDLQPADNAATTRTGTMTQVPGTKLVPGSYVVDFPYVSGKTSIAINVRHRHLCNLDTAPIGTPAKSAEIKLQIDAAGSSDTACASNLLPLSGNLATSNGVAYAVQKCSNDLTSTCLKISLDTATSANIDKSTTVDFSMTNGDPGMLVFSKLQNPINLK